MTRKILTLAAALLVLGFGPLFARPGAGGPAGPHGAQAGPGQGAGQGPELLHPRFLSRYLELTEAQQAELQTVFQTHREAVRPLHDQMKTVYDELHAMLDSDTPDATAIGETMLELKSLRDQASATRDLLIQDVRAILTPAQQEKLERLLEIVDLMGRRGLRGRG